VQRLVAWRGRLEVATSAKPPTINAKPQTLSTVLPPVRASSLPAAVVVVAAVDVVTSAASTPEPGVAVVGVVVVSSGGVGVHPVAVTFGPLVMSSAQ
jgi:hypothetical protein